MARKYELKKRAAQQEETRRRIVESTVELHETVGFARTTISAIAERAGVERLTVYRHFPDELSLLSACSAHWAADHPLPDTASWESIADPEERLRAALAGLYAFYEGGEGLIANVVREIGDEPALGVVSERFFDYFGHVTDGLLRGFRARGSRRARLRAAIAHAVDFSTWRSLVRVQGLETAAAIDLMACLVRCAGR
jgi:AcrR family transcriptional regulator